MSEDQSRRAFLKLVGGASCAAGTLMVGAPVASALLAPLSRDSVTGITGFMPTVSVDAVPADGTPVAVSIVAPRPRDAWTVLPPTEVGSVYLQRVGADIVALSTICPHLGCKVDLAAGGYRCACHDTDFAADGAVIEGPSPRGLDRLETRVEGGVIQVKYLRFKTGTADRVPV